MGTPEIVLPETTPETEWVRGRPVQKMSPQRDHGRLQSKLAALLDAWAGDRGEVATEWRFRIAPPGQVRRPLVPDIAFVAAERLRGRSSAEIQIPLFAPTVAVEILSPGDDPLDVASKAEAYLAAGSDLVVVVDASTRTIRLRDPARDVTFTRADVVRHPALPEFALDVGAYFDAALRLIDDR